MIEMKHLSGLLSLLVGFFFPALAVTYFELIVIVGPYPSVSKLGGGEPRELVVANEVQNKKPPFEPFMQCLEDEGYFSTMEDDAGTKQLRPLTMYLGSGQPMGQIQPGQAQQWHIRSLLMQSKRRQTEFLNYFGRLVAGLFLDRRLTALGAAGVMFVTQPPHQHDLHALYLDDNARTLLFEEMLNIRTRSVARYV